MNKTAVSILIIMVLCLFSGPVGSTYAAATEQDTDQEMQQNTSKPSDQGAGSESATPQGEDTQSGQSSDQGAGSSQGETPPPDKQ